MVVTAVGLIISPGISSILRFNLNIWPYAFHPYQDQGFISIIMLRRFSKLWPLPIIDIKLPSLCLVRVILDWVSIQYLWVLLGEFNVDDILFGIEVVLSRGASD